MPRPDKHAVFTEFAERLASLSTCKRNQVGCVIIPTDFSAIFAIGYNGPPSGEPNDACIDSPGNCGCIHAEANAIAKLGAATNAMLISTVCPCWQCAGLIINCKKISRVMFIHPYRDNAGEVLLKRHVSVFQYRPDVPNG